MDEEANGVDTVIIKKPVYMTYRHIGTSVYCIMQYMKHLYNGIDWNRCRTECKYYIFEMLIYCVVYLLLYKDSKFWIIRFEIVIYKQFHNAVSSYFFQLYPIKLQKIML